MEMCATIIPEGYLHQDLQRIQYYSTQPEVTGVLFTPFSALLLSPVISLHTKSKRVLVCTLHPPSPTAFAPAPLPLLLQVVCAPSVLVGNSAGALAALQAAVADPAMARGLMLLDCSLRYRRELVEGMLEQLCLAEVV
jgi:hypothetical protein